MQPGASVFRSIEMCRKNYHCAKLDRCFPLLDSGWEVQSAMAAQIPKVLLIAASPMGVSFLTERLKGWACEIYFASSCKEAVTSVSNHRFDLVLSEFGLRGDSSSVLAASLVESRATLVYSYPVETSCWWLPAVKNGQLCWGSLAMRPSEFMGFLDDLLKEIRSCQKATSGESRAASS